MTVLPTPSFSTSRLYLRPLTELDSPSYEKHFLDYEVIRNLAGGVPWPYPEGGVLEYINQFVVPRRGMERWIWGITKSEAPQEVIGAIELYRNSNPSNRGFWLGRNFWGQGLMTEAVKPVTDIAFGPAGFDKLIFTNAVGNTRSGRIKDKTGARFLRTEPAQYVDPKFTAPIDIDQITLYVFA